MNAHDDTGLLESSANDTNAVLVMPNKSHVQTESGDTQQTLYEIPEDTPVPSDEPFVETELSSDTEEPSASAEPINAGIESAQYTKPILSPFVVFVYPVTCVITVSVC